MVLHRVSPQLPGGLNVLGDEAKLVLASADPVVVLRLHRIEEPLEVLIRHAPDVFLEPPVRGVQVAITEDHLPFRDPPVLGSMAKLAMPFVLFMEMNWNRLFSCTPPPASAFSSTTPFWLLASSSKEASPVGRGIPRHHNDGAVGGPHRDLLQQRAEHLHTAGAARQAQEGQRRLGGEDPVDAQGIVHQHPLVPPWIVSNGAAGSLRTTRPCTRRSLSICCVAVMELLLAKVPVAAVEPTKNGAKSAVVALRVRSARTVMSCLQAYAAGCEAGQQGAVFGTDGGGGVPDLQVRGSTLQQWRVHEARGREAVDREVRRGIHSGGRSPGP